MTESLIALLPEFQQAIRETLLMLAVGLANALVFGGAVGTLLFMWGQQPNLRSRFFYNLVGTAVNVVRSFPFVILMIAVSPMTRKVTGSTIGPLAAAVPLSLSAVAYFARIVELALTEVPQGVIEAAHAMGASNMRIIFNVLYVEARASLILGFTTLTVSYLSYTAAAGIVGGGGIGDLAIRYGYYRFQDEVMAVTIVGLIIFVQSVQVIGNHVAHRVNQH